jgi:hypothetical protein
MTAAPALSWHAFGAHQRAWCGPHGDGVVIVHRRQEGWSFRLDMLPGDPEPLVVGDIYLSPEGARAAAERQADTWPALIEGARRV